MSFTAIKELVCSIPEVAAWPEMLELIERIGHRESISVWEYLGAACTALGGDRRASLPAEAAVFCSLISIKLVDDMIDNDPTGLYRRAGTGTAANLALAFQAASHRVLERADVPVQTLVLLHHRVAGIALATALGQHLDITEAADETGYWRVVHAKTPPLFSAATALGALIAGGSEQVTAGLESFAHQLACFIQVNDDLGDALKTPAEADWRRPNNNLALLYAQQVDRTCRDRFLRLAEEPSCPDQLAEAQSFLLSCGAVSYCVFKMIELWQAARRQLAELDLRDPGPLDRLLSSSLHPLERLFASLGDELPQELRNAMT